MNHTWNPTGNPSNEKIKVYYSSNRWDPTLCKSYNNQTPNAQPQVQQSKFLFYKNDSDNNKKKQKNNNDTICDESARRSSPIRRKRWEEEGQGNVRCGGEGVLIARWLSRIILLCCFCEGTWVGPQRNGWARAPIWWGSIRVRSCTGFSMISFELVSICHKLIYVTSFYHFLS